MTLGEWLDDAIAERAARLRMDPDELDEANQVEAVAARLVALPRDDGPHRAPRPLPRSIEIDAAVRGRKPNNRLLDAAAARLGHGAAHDRGDVAEVARRIAELEDALGRRPPHAPDLSPRIESRLRRITASLLDEGSAQPSQDLRRIEARLDRLAEKLDDAPRAVRPETDLNRADFESLRKQIEDLSRAVVAIGDRAAKPDFEPALLDLLSRIESSRHDGLGDEALAPVMSALLEIHAALENAPTTTARAMRAEIDTLHRRLDLLAQTGDRDGLRELRNQVETLARGLADLVARLSGQDALNRQIAALAQRVEELASAPREMAEHLAGSIDDLRVSLEQIDSSPAFRSLQRQIEDMAWQCGEAPAAIMEGLHGIRAALDDVADRASVGALQAEVSGLAHVAGESPRRLMERIDDLHRAVASLAGHPGLGDELRAAPLPTHVIEDLAEIRLSLERLAAQAGVRPPEDQAQRLQHIEARLAGISEKLESPPIIERVAGAQEAVLARIDRLRGELPNDQLVALRARVEEIHRAISQPRPPERSAHDLEEIVNELAAKLDRTANAGAQDPRALQAIENQVLRIAERLDRHGETSEAIQTLERSISELVEQIADRQAGAEPLLGETISRDLSSLRNLQDETDRRTRATLEAVHETLEKVVDRLAMLEGDVGALRETPPKREQAAPALAPLTPSAPSRQDVALELSEPRAAQKSFIAAARRATQLMGAAPQPPRIEHDTSDLEAARSAAEPAHSPDKKLLGDLSRRAMLGVAGLVLSMGAYQLLRDESPLTSAGPPQEAVAEKVAEVAAPSPLPVDAAGVLDPTPVGSIKPPATALAVLRELAEAGNAPAQLELASRLIEGAGVERDVAQGVRWISKAAQAYAPAQYRLGALYEKGVGVERSMKEAAQWYGRAAQAGHVRAMHNLGVLLAEGVDRRPDYSAAAAMFRQAAEHGLRDSQYNLAVLQARGIGVETNLVEAYKFFELAGAQGDADALTRRDEIAARMLPDQINAARSAVEGFTARTIDPAANQQPAMDAIVAAGLTAKDQGAPNARTGDARVTSLK